MLGLMPNVVLLMFLYFIQGLPYGLQAQFLPVYLRTKGLNLTSIGLLKVLYVPWLFKFLWGPLVDRYGTRRRWLLGSVCSLGIVCLAGATHLPVTLPPVALVLLLLNLFASIQDVAVDAIAISLLKPEELALGNTAQVVGYKLGSIFAGGILGSFLDTSGGWSGQFFVLTLLYAEAALFISVSPNLRRLEHAQQRLRSGRCRSLLCKGPVGADEVAPTESSTDAPNQVESDSSSEEEIDAQDPNEASIYQEHCEEDSNQTDLGDRGGCQNHSSLYDISMSPVAQLNDDETVLKDPSTARSNDCRENEDCLMKNDVHINESLQKNGDHSKYCLGEASSNKHLTSGDILGGEITASHQLEAGVTIVETVKPRRHSLEQTQIDPTTSGVQYAVQPRRLSIKDPTKPVLGASIRKRVSFSSDTRFKDEKVPCAHSHGIYEDLSVILSPGQSLMNLVSRVTSVPGTRWMIVFLLIYKLGETGALGMLPMVFLDNKIPATDVTFWTGVVGQGVSVLGSVLGGLVLSTFSQIPLFFLLQQLSLLRLLPIGAQLLIVVLWTSSAPILLTQTLFSGAVLSMLLLQLLGGIVTTITFTLMMQCSQTAVFDLQATHYTMLATAEILGKLTFSSLCGWLADVVGYRFLFLILAGASVSSLVWLRFCPEQFYSSGDDTDDKKNN